MQEEKRFLRGLKERQEADMKVFINQQKADLRSTKNLYKKVSFITAGILYAYIGKVFFIRAF